MIEKLFLVEMLELVGRLLLALDQSLLQMMIFNLVIKV